MRIQIILLLFFASIQMSYSQHYDFSHLNNTNGLPNNQVEYIFKDSKGFIWFSTNTGVNRYDGINFKEFKHVKGDATSSPFDRYIRIEEDGQERLWLTAENTGYAIFDLKHNAFIQNVDSILYGMALPASPNIVEIDKQKNIFCYYKDVGIYKYDITTKECIYYEQSESQDKLSSVEIEEFKVDKEFIWVLFKNGLLERLNQNTGKVDLADDFHKKNHINTTIKKRLFVDKDRDIWIFPSVNDRGIAYFEVNENKWIKLTSEPLNKLSNSFIRQISQDSEGLLWIGSDHGGLIIFDKKTSQALELKNNIHNNKSIGQNSVISVYCDSDGIMWIGTYKNGVSYYHPKMFKFKGNSLRNYFDGDNQMLDCNSLYKDEQNNLWIGTNGRGLIQYNEDTKKMKLFENDASNSNSISSNIITAIFGDKANTLWVGTFLGGLNAYSNGKFKRYQVDESNPNSLSSRSVYGIAEDDRKNLWIGTLGGGVSKLDPTRSQFTHYNLENTDVLSSNFVLSMYKAYNKDIYISTDQGVNRVSASDEQISSFLTDNGIRDSITSVSVNNLIVDSRDYTWIATNNGLNIYDPTTQRITQLTVADGLPSNEVVSLIEDDNRNIWAGTRNGLAYICSTFDGGKRKYNISYFDMRDGLPSSVCNQNAIFKDTEGNIYVGCTNGYVSFKPNDILSLMDPKAPQPTFTELTITNQIIKPNTEYNGRVILKESIFNLHEIILHHKETNFTVHFSALNYIHPKKSKYRYMLKELDEDWTEISDGIGQASYSNLRAGSYELVVYASNGDNLWSEEPLTLSIIVKPPFWLSWWAFVFYTLLAILLLRFFIKWRLYKLKQEFEQAQRIQEANKLHEIDELKFKFFTNISHEFKTPLTLIITPLDRLLKDSKTEADKSMLTIIHRNARKLLKMVDEILDFRKLDLDKMTISYSTGDIISYLRNICQSFSSLASEKSIKLTFATFADELFMDFDRTHVNKIVENLLSNAFKYTDYGQIDMSVGLYETIESNAIKMLSIKVTDTGIGIKKEHLDKIFDRFYSVENPTQALASGTGVGLHLASEYVKMHGGEISVESVAGKGSVFSVLLPIKASSRLIESFDNEEKQQDNVEPSATPTEKIELNHGAKQNLPTLMVVDDNEDFCSFIRNLFSEEYKVVTAYDGEEASQLVLEVLPDIILSDVMMPKMNGYEFCQKIKTDIRTSHIPIILLTAKTSEENEYEGIKAGADDYISKPFNVDMLMLKIGKIVENQKQFRSSFNKKIEIVPSKIEIKTMDEKFIEKAVAIVEKNIGNTEFLVEDLCKEMAMSRVYFYKKVLTLTDKSPSEFIRFIRLKRAGELLEKSQMFVNEIAFEVGFNDPKYFRKHFKDEFGTTPSEYKKKHLEEGE